MQRIKAAVIQMCSTEDVERNLARAAELARAARADGAQLLAFPENASYLRFQSTETYAEPLEGRTATYFAHLARELHAAVLVGSFPQESDDPQRVFNTSLLLDPHGVVVARYEKIHLFDIDIPGQVTIKESDHIRPGSDAVVASLLGTRFGLSICYDMRFPELYRKLQDQDAEVLMVPAAFTLMTGKDHWEVLLRARAIENQCYVIAPGQWGPHGGTRHSYGHSMIIDPWGHVIARVSDGEGFATAWLEPEKVAQVRRNLPCRSHRRF
ncbi:MAG: carbon-nitrogen hydrolase family protein [Myxococcota bacterium]